MSAAPTIPFDEAVQGFLNGDFSRLDPLFASSDDGQPALVIQWFEAGRFAGKESALDEVFSCACFNGRLDVVQYLLAKGRRLPGGSLTGLDAFHWAVNRGQLPVVELLLQHRPALETRNMHGGTALGMAVWSAVHEPRPSHPYIIRLLIAAGAIVNAETYPSGNAAVDEILKPHLSPA